MDRWIEIMFNVREGKCGKLKKITKYDREKDIIGIIFYQIIIFNYYNKVTRKYIHNKVK